MIVAGVMSGTSADGVDVAICRITASAKPGGTPRIKLLHHAGFPYPKAVRIAVLSAMNAESISVAEMSRLNWRLGEVYADAIERAALQAGVKLDFAACHGQTIYHQSIARKYLGKAVRTTWQIGEASVIAERLRVPVVSDFRPADLAAGGQGAPLVPMLDYTMFRDAKKSRVLLNLGGIANLTAIPAGASIDRVMAFDTGPANMIIDAAMLQLFQKKFDANGATANRGVVLQDVIDAILKETFFLATPPKSCGREEFGNSFASRLIEVCHAEAGSDSDIIATATALTVQSIFSAYRTFVWPHLGQNAPLARTELIVAGGGAKNKTMMRMLAAEFAALGVPVRPMDDLGIPAQAKEAVAFALLGWLTWHRLPGNVTSATGATREVILGKVTHP
ncbi:anhydro-N-acetylmuramic acid kinase [Granulicella aggregans]|uniref:Anhydro-N-acetylmuramic acid kinase n=1 Tax=Granulicella aggregans TaxID=474949 RepID=A0A7W8E3H2_9BACT|nr:anhydro-N-acetylmuramic acid kinase [Granulicella aggregans]MBB5057978.1 anhydro-N-acetylmuramic acid kinase [Granulicella aggregans]